MRYKIQSRFFIYKCISIFFVFSYIINSYATNNFIFIINPEAGDGTCEKRWNYHESEILKKISKNNNTYMIFKTIPQDKDNYILDKHDLLNRDSQLNIYQQPINAATTFNTLLEENYINLSDEDNITTIVAVGGDGTFSQIANNLKIKERNAKQLNPNVEYKHTFAILPFGTGNSLAQGLKIPHERTNEAAMSAVNIIIDGMVVKAGCFQVNFSPDKTSYSFMELDFGASCKAGKLQKNPPCFCYPFWSHLQPQTQYDLSSIIASFNPPETVVSVKLISNDDKHDLVFSCIQDEQKIYSIYTSKNLTFGAASATPYFGGDFKIHPEADALGNKGYISFI